MESKKVKVLYLGHKDSNYAGHMYYNYLSHPNYFEKRIIVQRSNGTDPSVALYIESSLKYKVVFFIKLLFFKIISFIKYHEQVVIDDAHSEYCYYGNYLLHDSYKKILRRIKGFTPDIIIVGWVSSFINARDIVLLHKKTGAHIVIVFNDEAPMTGGCHYPIDCIGYQTNCSNCPALSSGKWLPELHLKEKKELFKNIPITIIATPYDYALVQDKSPVFNNCDYIPTISFPSTPECNKEECRQEFNIFPEEFVIFIGCNSLKEKRKGFSFALDAIKKVQENKNNLVLLLLGKDPIDLSKEDINARIISPGFLSQEKMCHAIKAADCFLSSTIADSGPMMVNYSIKLGTPVISFNVGIAYTLVKHKINGYLAKLYDTTSMAQGIDYIYKLPIEGREQLSIECINTYEEYKKFKPWHEVIYERFISGKLQYGKNHSTNKV